MRRTAANGLWRSVTLALIVLLGVGGCADFNLLSTEQEVRLGRQVAAEVEKKAKLYPDPAVQHYVQEIGSRVARVSDRRDVAYHYKVIEDHKKINAFALPGGFVYVNTALLRVAENEAEVASVLAHETSHVVARHSAKALSNRLAFSLVLSLALGRNPGLAAELGSQVLSGVGFSRLSQAAEYQADELGVLYLKRAGYDPRASVTLLRKLDRIRKTNPGPLLQLFASHPLPKDRIQRAEGLIAAVGPGGHIGANTYKQRMARLLAEVPLPQGAISGADGPAPGGPSRRMQPESPPAAPTRRGQGHIMICRNITKGNVVGARIELAASPEARRRGLLGRSGLAPGEGLLLVPCRSVHTMRMKFPIDIVFISKQMRVVKVLHNVQPGAMFKPSLKAHSTLELPAGTAAVRRVEVGDHLLITPAAEHGP